MNTHLLHLTDQEREAVVFALCDAVMHIGRTTAELPARDTRKAQGIINMSVLNDVCAKLNATEEIVL